MGASRSRRKSYKGDKIEIIWNASRCIHAAECVSRQPAVFDSKRRPWIEPDASDADGIAQAIAHCPTGALNFARLDSGPAEEPASTARIQVRTDGPLYARGNLAIEPVSGDQESAVVSENRAALCRCGASENKPFCDRQHVDAGFQAPGSVAVENAPEGQPASGSPGPLRFEPMPDGPLIASGKMIIAGQDGDVSLELEKGALCRCGASKKKPFCDGAHRAIGFKG